MKRGSIQVTKFRAVFHKRMQFLLVKLEAGLSLVSMNSV